MRKITKYLLYSTGLSLEVILLPVYFASKWAPKDKDLWIFGAWHGKRYCDNSRYLFEYACGQCRDIRAVWLTRDPMLVSQIRALGYEAYRIPSLKGLWIAARAAVNVVTHDPMDTSGLLTRGSITLNLTHGTPLKKIRRDLVLQRFGPLTRFFDRQIRPRLPSYRTADVICVSCDEVRKRLVSAFKIDRQRVLPLGFPRWVPFHSPNSLSEDVRKIQRKTSGKRVLLYAPTHRGAGRKSLSIFGIAGYTRFVEWLGETDSVLLVRPHNSLKLQGGATLGTQDNVHVVDNNTVEEINDLLLLADVLITDYSSVVYDFTLLHKPFVMLAHDLAEYSKHDAGLYGDYGKEFESVLASNWLEVIETIDCVDSDDKQRFFEMFSRKYGHMFDGSECARIMEEVSSISRQSLSEP